MMKSIFYVSVVLLGMISAVTAATPSVVLQHAKELNALGARLIEQPVVPRAFEFTDHHAQAFTNESLKGKWTLVFFGYTSCSDICPTTLAALNTVYQKLDDARTGNKGTQVVFISVDPLRDTLAVLKEHIAFFNPVFLGVTGSRSELDKLSQDLEAFYDYREKGTKKLITNSKTLRASDEYIVGHMADLFIFDPNGKMIGYIFPPHEPKRVLAAYQRMRELYLQDL